MNVPDLSRRRALTAAAWTPPVILAASASPTYASSTSTRSRYLLDWASSGYVPAASPLTAVAVVAHRVSGTAGPATLALTVRAEEIRMGGPARWLPYGVDDMTLTAMPEVNGRQALVMSSRAAENRGLGRTIDSLSRSLILTPAGFTMRALRVEVGPMECACTGHGTSDHWLDPGYVDPMTGSHSRADALHFACGHDIYTAHLDMVETTQGLDVEIGTASRKHFVARNNVTSAVFESVDTESAIANLWGQAEVHISHYNRCGGKLTYDYSGGGSGTAIHPWSPWTSIRTVFGAISFDVEHSA